MNLTTFKQYLQNKTIALIGPAATLHKSKLGSKIDTYDITCRLNHHLVDSNKMVKDCGSKNDVVFSGPNLLYCHYEILEKVQPKFICFPRANISDPNYYRGMISQIKCDHPEIQCFHVGDEFPSAVEMQMKTSPNTGILAISYLLSMQVKKLLIAGFDFYQNPKIYFDKPGRSSAINRDYEKLIEEHGFIKFSSEHDQESHMNFFSKLYSENSSKIELDEFLKNTFS